ncbi:MLO-like protein 3 [Hevea brasiliensis]|nr:MLO-like protein 3 [Hevea brasiliensis]
MISWIMAAGDSSSGSLEYTPTWALATVCFVFISISIVIEHIFHLLTNWLKSRRKTALSEAVVKLKSELMLLGFISLMLAVTQESISKICIPTKIADSMLPCRKEIESETIKVKEYEHFVKRLAGNWSLLAKVQRHHRILADDEADETSADSDDPCSSKGKVSLIAEDGIHQLHIFIFVLAVMQIVYSVLTMALGRAKMRRWKAWENETQTTEYQVANDPNRFRFARQTTFGRRHITSYKETSAYLWTKCFFRQFFNSVAKVDYLTLRHGFISAHMSTLNNNFNFQQYIQRSLDEDFKIVVSISPLMWLLVVIFMLVDVRGWKVFVWISYIPLLVVLILGTKLEVIVERMAMHINEQNSVIIGTPLVQPNDNLFWFGRPQFVLTLLHYTLFLNAFELAFFIWVTIEFGLDSCYHEHTVVVVARVVLAVTVQVLCSYITLPLHALVTQMGSEFKSKVVEEQVAQIIKQWHEEVRERRKKQEKSLQSLRDTSNLSADWSFRNMRSPTENSRLENNYSEREIAQV